MVGDRHVGLQARLMRQSLRKITGAPEPFGHHPRLHHPLAKDRSDVRSPKRQRAEGVEFYASIRLDVKN